jgi:hypothetical protein
MRSRCANRHGLTKPSLIKLSAVDTMTSSSPRGAQPSKFLALALVVC